jgi:hypothetical protein
METNWDRFPSNLCEMLGPINRNPFNFNYNRFEVWQGGKCIYAKESHGTIIAKIVNSNLHVAIDNVLINNYIKNQFSFGEISTNNERLMWSKDFFNSKGKIERNNPDISSLFYKEGVLMKVTFTIHDPNTLIEFYS